MTFRCDNIIANPRKGHVCDYCGGWIPKGQSHVSIAGKWVGEFYTARGHHDCIAMWNECYPIYADFDEGMAFRLQEAIDDTTDLLSWRGIVDPFAGAEEATPIDESRMRALAKAILEEEAQDA